MVAHLHILYVCIDAYALYLHQFSRMYKDNSVELIDYVSISGFDLSISITTTISQINCIAI